MNKMMKHLLLSVVLFVTSNAVFAQIIESKNLEIVLQLVQKGDLIVFDIDNTVSNPTSYVGTSPWFDKKVKKLVKNGMSYHEAATKMEMVHEFVDLEIICNSDQVIQKLQKEGFPVIALTNRSIPIAKRTIEQMKEIGLYFSKTAPIAQDLDLFCTYRALYSYGIIFSAHNDKGKILFDFLSKLEKETFDAIKRIVFIDDRLSHVKAVQAAAIENKFAFVGVHLEPPLGTNQPGSL